uniref:GRIP domain-containing protein n=1 Tax=Strongyloides stercoralis TaxID=6248 RepID=A0A913HYR7_STRER
MNDTLNSTELETSLNSLSKSSSPSAGKLRSNKRVSIQFDPNRSIVAAGVSERLLNQPGLENVKLYIEEIKSAYEDATVQNKEALKKIEELKKKLDDLTISYEEENTRLKNSIRMSDYSYVQLTQEIKLLKRHLSIKNQDDSEVKHRLNELLKSYDDLLEEMEEVQNENDRLKDTIILVDSYEGKIKEYVEMVKVLSQDKDILEIRLSGLQKELQKQMLKNSNSDSNNIELHLQNASIKQLKKQNDKLLSDIDIIKNEKTDLDTSNKQLRDTIFNLEIDLKYFQDQVVDQVKLIEKQQKEIMSFKNENHILNETNTRLNEQLQIKESSFLSNESKLQEEISSIILQNKEELEKIKHENDIEKEELIKKHQEMIQMMEEKHKEAINEIRKKDENKIDAMKVQFNEQLDIVAIAATSRSEDKIKELKNQIKDYENQINNLTTENKKILEEKINKEKELEDAKKIYTENLKEKCDECTELKVSLSHKQEDVNKYVLCVEELEENITTYKNKIETILEPTINSLTEQNKKLEEQYVEKYTLNTSLQMELEEKKREIEFLKMQKDNTVQQTSTSNEGHNNNTLSDQYLHELSEYKRYSMELLEAYNSLKLSFDNQVQIINEGKIYTEFVTKKLEEKDFIINVLEEKLKDSTNCSNYNQTSNKDISDNDKEIKQNEYSTNNLLKEDDKNILVCKNCEKLAKDISALDYKAQDLISQISFMQKQISGLNIQATSYSDKIEQLEQQIEVYEEERLEHETKENEMREKIKKLENDNNIFSREIGCLKDQLCSVNQELIVKDQELSRHHEQLLMLEIEKERLSRVIRKSDLCVQKSDGDSVISKEIYETILSDSEMLISDLRDFVDRVSITLESIMSRPFPTLPEVDYPSMINIAKAVIQLIELIPSKEINDKSINATINPHINELNNKIRHLEDKLCENNQNWESFYKIEHDCRMSFEEKLKAAEEQISRLTIQLLEDKGIDELKKTIADSAITVIPPELLSSIPIGVKMKISILAAKLSTKMLDNDALLRANKEIADTNVLLQNRVDYYKEKLESLEENNKNSHLLNTPTSLKIENCEEVKTKLLADKITLTENTCLSQLDLPMMSNTESQSSILSVEDNFKGDQQTNISTDDENDNFYNKTEIDSNFSKISDEYISFVGTYEKLNPVTEEINYSFAEKCTEKNKLTIQDINFQFSNQNETFNCTKSFDISRCDSGELKVILQPTTTHAILTENKEDKIGSKINEVPDNNVIVGKSNDLKLPTLKKNNEDVDNQDFQETVNFDSEKNVAFKNEEKEILKNKKFDNKKNIQDNSTMENLVSKDNETFVKEDNEKSRLNVNDHVTLKSNSGSNKISGEKNTITRKPKQRGLKDMEVFDPFQIPQLPPNNEDNLFEDIFSQDLPIKSITNIKQKSTSGISKKKTNKKEMIGNDIFTNFNLPNMDTNPPSILQKGQKANFNSFNSKGAFVVPDKISLNRDYGKSKQCNDVILPRSETPKDFVPVDFQKEPPKSILKPRALSKPKYTN